MSAVVTSTSIKVPVTLFTKSFFRDICLTTLLQNRSFVICRRLLFVVCCLLFVVYWLLIVDCWLSFVDCCLLVDVFWFVVGCRLLFCRSPFAVCHLSSFVVRSLLFVVCCLLFVSAPTRCNRTARSWHRWIFFIYKRSINR